MKKRTYRIQIVTNFAGYKIYYAQFRVFPGIWVEWKEYGFPNERLAQECIDEYEWDFVKFKNSKYVSYTPKPKTTVEGI